jgi:hypothetical protein
METFSLVAKINTVHILLSLAVNLDWPLHQFDKKKYIFKWKSPRRSVYEVVPWL